MARWHGERAGSRDRRFVEEHRAEEQERVSSRVGVVAHEAQLAGGHLRSVGEGMKSKNKNYPLTSPDADFYDQIQQQINRSYDISKKEHVTEATGQIELPHQTGVLTYLLKPVGWYYKALRWLAIDTYKSCCLLLNGASEVLCTVRSSVRTYYEHHTTNK